MPMAGDIYQAGKQYNLFNRLLRHFVWYKYKINASGAHTHKYRYPDFKIPDTPGIKKFEDLEKNQNNMQFLLEPHFLLHGISCG